MNIKVTNNYESDRFTASVCGNKYACVYEHTIADYDTAVKVADMGAKCVI